MSIGGGGSPVACGAAWGSQQFGSPGVVTGRGGEGPRGGRRRRSGWCHLVRAPHITRAQFTFLWTTFTRLGYDLAVPVFIHFFIFLFLLTYFSLMTNLVAASDDVSMLLADEKEQKMTKDKATVPLGSH